MPVIENESGGTEQKMMVFLLPPIRESEVQRDKDEETVTGRDRQRLWRSSSNGLCMFTTFTLQCGIWKSFDFSLEIKHFVPRNLEDRIYFFYYSHHWGNVLNDSWNKKPLASTLLHNILLQTWFRLCAELWLSVRKKRCSSHCCLSCEVQTMNV